MAIRPVFISDENLKNFVKTIDVEFEWFPGFSIIQKQKSIKSLHDNFNKNNPSIDILEISTKSMKELGNSLSAFNLMIETKSGTSFSVETAFQASKVFEFGGPYTDLYHKTSKEAKKDNRIKNSGNLICFEFFNRKFDINPKTLFYDWLYINALSLNEELSKQVILYNAFTDIEFNPQKSINCQARSAALYVSLYKLGLLDKALSSVENYKKIVIGASTVKCSKKESGNFKIEQLNIFDNLIEE